MRKIALYLVGLALLGWLACSRTIVPGSGENGTPELMPVDQVFETYKDIEAARIQHNPEDVKRIVGYTKHPDQLVRINAIKALSTDQLKMLPESEAVMIDRLNNDDYSLVRQFAARGLGKIRTPTAMNALKAQLEVEEDEKVQKQITKSIAGKTEGAKSVPVGL